jgi:hypothetical protein
MNDTLLSRKVDELHSLIVAGNWEYAQAVYATINKAVISLDEGDQDKVVWSVMSQGYARAIYNKNNKDYLS